MSCGTSAWLVVKNTSLPFGDESRYCESSALVPLEIRCTWPVSYS